MLVNGLHVVAFIALVQQSVLGTPIAAGSVGGTAAPFMSGRALPAESGTPSMEGAVERAPSGDCKQLLTNTDRNDIDR